LRIYPRVLSGFTVDEALYEARQAMYQRKGLKIRDWGVPVLYLHDESGLLFPLPHPDAAKTTQAGPFLDVANHFKEVEGEVIDVIIGEMTNGRIQIRDEVDHVRKGSKFTSVKIDKL